jgi:hypothetical protein
MDLARLIELLPLGLRQEDTERRALSGLLAPVAAVDDLLATRARRLGTLLDPTEAPDDTVRHLASLVGLGTDLGAANAATVAQLRKLIPVAVELWKRKGTDQSWRAAGASLVGSRSMILGWFYFRTISGSSAMVHTIPGPGVAGGYYGTPELVSDLWIQDPDGTADLTILARFLAELRPAGERINLYRCFHLDDGGAGAAQWTGSGSGSWSYDREAWELTTVDSYELAQDLGGYELAPWTPWGVSPGYAPTFRLAVTGQAVIRVFRASSASGWWFLVDQAAGTVALYRRVGGVDTLITTVAQPLAAAFPYRWTIEVLPNPGLTATTVRLWWEGTRLVDVVDATGGRPSSGLVSWGSSGTGSRATLSAFLNRHPGPAAGPTRIGLTP